jgi:hypothetical protein
VKRKQTDQKFLGRIRSGLKETGLIQTPVEKVSGHLFGRLIFWALNLTTVLLLCPFTWRSIAFEATAFSLLIYVAFKSLKVKASQTASLRLWTVATIMFLVATMCPFIMTSRPLYITSTESNNPFDSSLQRIESDGREYCSVFLISHIDAPRETIASILCHLFPSSFRILTRTDIGTRAYYRLPIFRGFCAERKEPGQVTWKTTVYFPCNPHSFGFDALLQQQHPFGIGQKTADNTIQFSSSSTSFGLVNFTYTQYRDSIPWDCVFVPNGQERSTLLYAALLDRSLEFFLIGKLPEAMRGLNLAATAVPTSNLEAARVSCLQYAFSHFYLRGNIGALQSLPYLHRTYDLLLHSLGDSRFSDRDPLSQWLRDVLINGYDKLSWSAMFFDRSLTLNALPHLESEPQPYTAELQRKLSRLSFDEIADAAASNENSVLDLNYMRRFVLDRVYRIIEAQIHAGDGGNSFIKAVSNEAGRALPALETIDRQLARRHSLHVNDSANRLLEFLDHDLEKLWAVDNSNTQHQLSVAKLFQNSPLSTIFPNIEFFSKNRMGIEGLKNGKSAEWLDSRYLQWFFLWGSKAIRDATTIDKGQAARTSDPFWDYDLQEVISSNGLNCFTRDLDGNGCTFIPGVFCLALYEQSMGRKEEADELKSEFEEQALLPFDVYVSLLTQPLSSR